MAQSHYNQTWVKLNATWSNGYRESKSVRDDSIYWRNCPQKPYGITPFLIDGDIGFDINGTKALVGQNFIGESDAYNTEADIRGNETPFNFTGNLPTQGVIIPPPPPPALAATPARPSLAARGALPSPLPSPMPSRGASLATIGASTLSPHATPFSPAFSSSSSQASSQAFGSPTVAQGSQGSSSRNASTQSQTILKPQRFLMSRGQSPDNGQILTHTQGLTLIRRLGLEDSYRSFQG